MSNIVNKDSKELISFLTGCQNIISSYFQKTFKNLEVPVITINNGRRYFKVIRVDDQQSVHCFVDRINGDVLKAASWKAPAKHARGNIFNKDNGLDCMDIYGAACLRKG